MSQDFPGKSIMVEAVRKAVSSDCTKAITDCLRDTLCDLIQRDDVQLPKEVFEPADGHYARRELYHDEEMGFSIMAMTWGPGQGTPIHDHDGMWCVEGVWAGTIEVVQFDLREQNGDNFRFEPVATMRTGPGSAGSLIPPHEYHTIRNPNNEETAVSVHIYRGEMNRCKVFLPQEQATSDASNDGWYLRQERQLACDA
jgi:predicted metal-dependent enzyme (double-stranded beta helix superfamily)